MTHEKWLERGKVQAIFRRRFPCDIFSSKILGSFSPPSVMAKHRCRLLLFLQLLLCSAANGVEIDAGGSPLEDTLSAQNYTPSMLKFTSVPAWAAGSNRFINRELSWLRFNERVLDEASNPSHPLMERVRFLSISANNLDEFYMVRVAGLKGQAQAGVSQSSADGLSPAQQLIAINRRTTKLIQHQQGVWRQLVNELEGQNVRIFAPSDLDEVDRLWLNNHFNNEVFPQLTPMSVDPAHPFPFLANKGYGLVLQQQGERDGEELRMEGLLLFPSTLQRYILLPPSPTKPGTHLISLSYLKAELCLNRN
jgi:polyphosphate kinase